MKTLIVNADDFGFTRDVSDGIVAAHRQGILTATTLMANGAAFEYAVELARACPSLDIGCHLVLVQGESVLTPGRPLPQTLTELVKTVLGGRLPVYEELRAQIEKILAAGIKPTHLDTHKHTHLLPAVLNAVARLSQEYGIRWVRRPFDLPLTYRAPWKKHLVSKGIALLSPRFERVLSRYGCRSTDHFAGFEITGRFHAADLVTLFRELPEGTTEFMCHPGFCTAELKAAATRLKESRSDELAALVDPTVRAAIDAAGVRLSGYRSL